MRRRREIDLKNDIEDVVLTKAKGVLGWIIRGLLTKLVEAILKMLRDNGWVRLEEDEEGI